MNMPFTIQLVNNKFEETLLNALDIVIKDIEGYLDTIEKKYSPFIATSWINNHLESDNDITNFLFDEEYQEIYMAVKQFEKESYGAFNPFFDGKYNHTGFVKGYAIETAFFKFLKPLIDNNILEAAAINGGGDMQVGVADSSSYEWNVGIENPFNKDEFLATYTLKNGAVATSGLNKRGAHIKSDENSIQIQNSVVGTYLSDVDVWATVGISANFNLWQKIIEEKNLMGITVLKNGEIVPFERGKIINVKKS